MPKVTTYLFDFARVLVHPKDSSYAGKLNDLYRAERSKPTFQFFDFFVLDGELLGWLASQKNKYKLALYTAERMQNDPSILPKLQEVFGDYIFSGEDLGISKSKPSEYAVVVSRLGEEPASIVFVDDNLTNIKAAKDAGLQAIQFYSREQIITELSKLSDEGGSI